MTDTTNPKDKIGMKKDPISLVPPEGIRQIAKAMKYGAYEALQVDGTKGYGPYNWRDKQVQYTIYLDAILRHALKLVDREDIDTDSGQHHLAHIGANVCLLLDAMKYNCLLDNRPENLSAKSLNKVGLTEDVDEKLLTDGEFFKKQFENLGFTSNTDLRIQSGTVTNSGIGEFDVVFPHNLPLNILEESYEINEDFKKKIQQEMTDKSGLQLRTQEGYVNFWHPGENGFTTNGFDGDSQ